MDAVQRHDRVHKRRGQNMPDVVEFDSGNAVRGSARSIYHRITCWSGWRLFRWLGLVMMAMRSTPTE
eukprot:1145767-Pelagomonas_calceolata.AAC.3